MLVKMIKDEDFVNYKKASMFIGTPYCTFKCCVEARIPCSVCQNYEWNNNPNIDFSDEKIVHRYLENPITTAIVFGGLEPLDSWNELLSLIDLFRKQTDDDIVIYTGYKEDEIGERIAMLKKYKNIIVKFGRYFQGHEKHYDEVLGVELASNNQYAKRIS